MDAPAPPPSRFDPLATRAIDLGIVLASGALTLAVAVSNRPPSWDSVPRVVLPAVLSVLPLLARRRWPLATLLAVLALSLAVPGALVFSPAALVGVYTVASRRQRWLALLATAAAIATFLAHWLLWGYELSLATVVSIAALPACALAVGLYRRTRLAYLEQLRERAARLERERTLLAEQAVAEERLRIARELHDVVGHNVSLMVIGAQALGAQSEDENSCRAADSIARLGRETMAEMHAMLGLMRPGGADAERAPQPRLEDLRRLVAQTREAGLAVELRVEGEPRPLPAALDVSAYRIVQEALTNVVRHAEAGRASVRVSYGSDELGLEVRDDGRGQNGEEELVPGHGMVGMRERVALFGGELQVGTANGSGFRVAARLPCEGEAR